VLLSMLRTGLDPDLSFQARGAQSLGLLTSPKREEERCSPASRLDQLKGDRPRLRRTVIDDLEPSSSNCINQPLSLNLPGVGLFDGAHVRVEQTRALWRGVDVNNKQTPAGPQDSCRFADRGDADRGREFMQSIGSHHQIESIIRERQLPGVAVNECHAIKVLLRGSTLSDGEHLGREIKSVDLAGCPPSGD
jgi:hypothetical protein